MGAISSSPDTELGSPSVEDTKPLTTGSKNLINEQNGIKDVDICQKTPKVYLRRWIMVFIFASYSLSNAYQWIHLNIIGNIVLRYYNESLPGSAYQKQVAIDWLSMIYMLAYIPLIFPATWLLDKKGLRFCAIFGNVLNVVGACLKCFAVSPDRFALLMFAQTICACAQVFILGIPAHLAAVWFGPDEVSTATAIGVFGNQLGCAAGFMIPPQIVQNDPDINVIGKHLQYLFYGGVGVTGALLLLVIIVFKKEPPSPPSQAQAGIKNSSDRNSYFSSLRQLLTSVPFWLLTITYGINTGSYYGIGTLLNPIILSYFENQEKHAGMIGLTLVVAGVAGSIIAGVWLDKTKLFKSTTIGIYLLSCICMVVFTVTLTFKKIALAYLMAGFLGFFMTGYLPVGFEFAAEITYPAPEGTSSGLLNASAQVFGITFTLLMGRLLNIYGSMVANIVICVVLFIGTIVTVMIKADLKRQNAGEKLNVEALNINHHNEVDSNL